MEIVCCLSEISRMSMYQKADAFLFGSKFSLRFKYSNSELKKIIDFCDNHSIKKYIAIDAFMMEDDIEDLKNYLEYLKTLKIDGIYFNDLAVITLINEMNIKIPLIYDPDTLITNTTDSSFYISQGIEVVLAREITLSEIKEIISRLPNKCDLQVFGHTRMSYSKRSFLTNYFTYINQNNNLKDRRDIKIIEEKRDYALPIIEDEYGSRIYSDYIFEMLEEVNEIKDQVKRIIIEDIFINEDIVADAIDVVKGSSIDLKNKYPLESFKKGYLYTKTNKVKNE